MILGWGEGIQIDRILLLDTYFISRTNLTCFQKERKLLQNKRLDLDAAKTRLKKAKVAEARAAVSSILNMYITFTLIHNKSDFLVRFPVLASCHPFFFFFLDEIIY